MRRLRVLVVEDDAVLCMVLAELLAALGHDVCGTAATELDAIAAAAWHVPDLMIVDAHLKMGSGVSVMDAILRHTIMPHIFITGGSRLSIPAKATMLQKPFGAAGLKAALAEAAWQIEWPAPQDTSIAT